MPRINLSHLSKKTQELVRKELAEIAPAHPLTEFNIVQIIKNLEELVKQTTGKSIKLNVTPAVDRFNKDYLKVDSEDLISMLGINGLFKSLKIVDSGPQVTSSGELYIPLNWRWKHLGGGSNGASLLEATFNKEGEILKVFKNAD